MFEIGDRVIVTKDYEFNNTENQEGIVVEFLPYPRTICIMFDNKLKSGHNGDNKDNQLITKSDHCWNVDISYVKKIDTMKGEY